MGRERIIGVWGLAAAAFLASAGCADVRDRRKIKVEPGTDMARYETYGVLPFADDDGKRGKVLTRDLIKALEERGRKTVDPEFLQKEYRKVKGDAFGLTLFSLSTLRNKTKADLLVTGSVTPKTFSVVVQELESGDFIINVSIARRAGEIPDEEVRETIMKYLVGTGEADPSAPGADTLAP
ncbi:MAG: hypothetical protein HY924_16520 [Elusimicrobia bacterium]|nr:hypothetical protein [Elusimicrobiota bacterium]